MASDTFNRIYDIVKLIPEGMVSTYGAVAALAGNPRWPRVVGYALHANPDNSQIPCHRVVNRFGGTSEAFKFGGADIQRAMLEAEGVSFLPDGSVDMQKHMWPAAIVSDYRAIGY